MFKWIAQHERILRLERDNAELLRQGRERDDALVEVAELLSAQDDAIVEIAAIVAEREVTG